MISWAHELCGGTGEIVEVIPVGHFDHQPCPGPHVGPFLVEVGACQECMGTGEVLGQKDQLQACKSCNGSGFDGKEVWADPEKVEWRCFYWGDTTRCERGMPQNHGSCGFYPIGDRLQEAE